MKLVGTVLAAWGAVASAASDGCTTARYELSSTVGFRTVANAADVTGACSVAGSAKMVSGTGELRVCDGTSWASIAGGAEAPASDFSRLSALEDKVRMFKEHPDGHLIITGPTVVKGAAHAAGNVKHSVAGNINMMDVMANDEDYIGGMYQDACEEGYHTCGASEGRVRMVTGGLNGLKQGTYWTGGALMTNAAGHKTRTYRQGEYAAWWGKGTYPACPSGQAPTFNVKGGNSESQYYEQGCAAEGLSTGFELLCCPNVIHQEWRTLSESAGTGFSTPAAPHTDHAADTKGVEQRLADLEHKLQHITVTTTGKYNKDTLVVDSPLLVTGWQQNAGSVERSKTSHVPTTVMASTTAWNNFLTTTCEDGYHVCVLPEAEARVYSGGMSGLNYWDSNAASVFPFVLGALNLQGNYYSDYYQNSKWASWWGGGQYSPGCDSTGQFAFHLYWERTYHSHGCWDNTASNAWLCCENAEKEDPLYAVTAERQPTPATVVEGDLLTRLRMLETITEKIDVQEGMTVIDNNVGINGEYNNKGGMVMSPAKHNFKDVLAQDANAFRSWYYSVCPADYHPCAFNEANIRSFTGGTLSVDDTGVSMWTLGGVSEAFKATDTRFTDEGQGSQTNNMECSPGYGMLIRADRSFSVGEEVHTGGCINSDEARNFACCADYNTKSINRILQGKGRRGA